MSPPAAAATARQATAVPRGWTITEEDFVRIGLAILGRPALDRARRVRFNYLDDDAPRWLAIHLEPRL